MYLTPKSQTYLLSATSNGRFLAAGTRVKTEESPSSWRKRVSNPTFHGTPSPTSSRSVEVSAALLLLTCIA